MEPYMFKIALLSLTLTLAHMAAWLLFWSLVEAPSMCCHSAPGGTIARGPRLGGQFLGLPPVRAAVLRSQVHASGPCLPKAFRGPGYVLPCGKGSMGRMTVFWLW